jgi:hypothetical protein
MSTLRTHTAPTPESKPQSILCVEVALLTSDLVLHYCLNACQELLTLLSPRMSQRDSQIPGELMLPHM